MCSTNWTFYEQKPPRRKLIADRFVNSIYDADMNKLISVLTIVFVFQILIERVEFYNLTCHPEANWNIRAIVHCNSTSKYFCLYNNVKDKYVEGCNGPDWDRKGSKRLYSGSFTRGNCSQNHYQPFLYWTNGSSDCMFAKSVCGEEGQLVYKDNSTKDDRVCNCDYTRNYAFIKTPRNLCYCIPTEEDCSCYIKQCLVNNTLSADYECIESDYQKETKCRQTNKHPELLASMEQVTAEIVRLRPSETTLKINRKILSAVIMLTLFYAVAIVFAVVIPKLTIDGQKSFKRCYPICQKGNLSIEEIYYLRLIRLLFKVAHPVVRKIFDNVIPPKELRTTLDGYKTLLETQYRDTKHGINDFQWNLLYEPIQGKTVTSQDFDIKLMLLLLRSLANYKISDLYEDKSDTSINAKFSRIKYVRNEMTRRFEGKLSKSLFNQYRDDIFEVVHETRTLANKHTENGQAQTRQIDCLDVKCVQTAKDIQILEETIVPTIEENYFLVVYHVIATIVYPAIQKAYGACTSLDRNSAEIHQTHCSEEESKNSYIRLMIDYLKKRAEEKEETDYIVHLDVIKDMQREIVQSSSGVLTERRFHEILTSLREAVLHLGGTFSEEKLLELQQIKYILE